MKKLILILIVLLLLLPVNAFAVSTELSTEQMQIESGDSVLIDVAYREESIGAVYASFTYDSTILEYIGGEGSVGMDGQGAIALYASSASSGALKTTLEFKALRAGSAEIALITQEALSFDEKPLEFPEAKLALNIAKDADSYAIVTIGEETMHLLAEPPYIPEGYKTRKIDIAGKTVIAAVCGEREYVYITHPDELTGVYYLRDNGNYVRAIETEIDLLLQPFPKDAVPEGYTVKENAAGGEICTDGTEYLVCAMDKNGEKKIYAFDPETKELRRKDAPMLAVTRYEDITQEYNMTVLYILCGIFIALLFAILIGGIIRYRRRDKNQY